MNPVSDAKTNISPNPFHIRGNEGLARVDPRWLSVIQAKVNRGRRSRPLAEMALAEE